MNKNEFIQACLLYEVTCKYSGHTKTMYVSGKNIEHLDLDATRKHTIFNIIIQ